VIEFDLNRALFLTYAGVGAAFLVLGALVVFTGLIGRWGDWRLRRAQARAEEAAAAVAAPPEDTTGESEPGEMNPEVAAVIGAALAMAVAAYRREQADSQAPGNGRSGAESSGWREQGRIVAFDARRLRERDR
jgi:Na+-transporting methylmalonyl-CoA/oxaloacetate decarboxylase gamma subunit